MEQSSSYDETTVRHQFDRKCKLALDGEVVDYDRHMDYRRKHEILFSELSECQTGKLSVVDEYNETSYFFKTCEYDKPMIFQLDICYILNVIFVQLRFQQRTKSLYHLHEIVIFLRSASSFRSQSWTYPEYR